ncbi:MAG TPA: BON domain-containing protein [Myxococcota bacterium]|jgi:hyperosmotically inducible protein
MLRPIARLALPLAIVAFGFLPADSAAAGTLADAWLTTKVKAALVKAPSVESLAIDVDAFGDLVTLHGVVSDEAERTRAGSAALDIDGVGAVRNLIAVVPDAERADVQAMDTRLEREIERALAYDAALARSQVQVKSIHAGIALLEGEAASASAHRRALRVARTVADVRRVASEIRSPNAAADLALWEQDGAIERRESASGVAFSDAWITTKAKLRLKSELGLSLREVHVETNEGHVTVFGIVPSQRAREQAEAQLLRIDGVRRVTNGLQVAPNA